MGATRALAADFDWQAHRGVTIKLLLDKHPYADAMIANLQAFKDLTGMEVVSDVFPEDVHFEGHRGARLRPGGIRRLRDRRLHDLDL